MSEHSRRASDLNGLLGRAKNALRIGEHELAESLLARLCEAKPDFALGHTLLGNVHELRREHEKAFAEYRTSIEIKPENPEAYNNLGIALKNSGRFDEALEALVKALSWDKDRADIRYNIANVHKERGDLETAVEEYENAIFIDPEFIPPYNNLGLAFEQLGLLEKAETIYRRGIKADKNNPRLHMNLGTLLEKRGELEQAAEEYTRALRSRPGKIDIMSKLAAIHARLGRHDKAIGEYEKILKVEPDNLPVMNNLGIEHVRTNNIEKATACYEKALRLDPEYDTAHFNMGSLLLEEGFYKEALDELRKVIAKNPHDMNARFELANAYLSLDRPDEAEHSFKKILADDPRNRKTIRALGNLYLRTGQYQKADDMFKKAADLDGTEGAQTIKFEKVLRDRDEFDKSKDEITAFLAEHPDDPQTKALIGELYQRLGDTEKAAAMFESAIEKGPKIVRPYYDLARIHMERKDPKKAIDILDRLISLHGTRGGSFDLLSLNEALDLYEEAAADYDKRGLGYTPALQGKGFRIDEANTEAARLEKDSVLGSLAEAKDLAVLRVGGREPVMSVKEEERVIRIDKVVINTDKVIQIEDREPPPLVDLLKNEELYEEVEKLKEWKRGQDQDQILDMLGREGMEADALNRMERRARKQRKQRPHRNDSGQNAAGYDDLSMEQRSIIDKVVEGMGNLMKALIPKIPPPEINATFRPAPDRNIGRDDAAREQAARARDAAAREVKDEKERKRAAAKAREEEKKLKDNEERQARRDLASQLLLNQERKTEEAEQEARQNKPKTLRDKLKAYIHKIRDQLDSNKVLVIPEDDHEKEKIKTLVEEIQNTKAFDGPEVETVIETIDTAIQSPAPETMEQHFSEEFETPAIVEPPEPELPEDTNAAEIPALESIDENEAEPVEVEPEEIPDAESIADERAEHLDTQKEEPLPIETEFALTDIEQEEPPATEPAGLFQVPSPDETFPPEASDRESLPLAQNAPFTDDEMSDDFEINIDSGVPAQTRLADEQARDGQDHDPESGAAQKKDKPTVPGIVLASTLELVKHVLVILPAPLLRSRLRTKLERMISRLRKE